MELIDIDLLEVKSKIEKIYGNNISEKSIRFTRKKVEKWASIEYTSHKYMGPPNNDDVGKPEGERFEKEMSVSEIKEYDISIEYILSIIEENKKYMNFMFSRLLETKGVYDKIPKKWKRECILKALLEK